MSRTSRQQGNFLFTLLHSSIVTDEFRTTGTSFGCPAYGGSHPPSVVPWRRVCVSSSGKPPAKASRIKARQLEDVGPKLSVTPEFSYRYKPRNVCTEVRDTASESDGRNLLWAVARDNASNGHSLICKTFRRGRTHLHGRGYVRTRGAPRARQTLRGVTAHDMPRFWSYLSTAQKIASCRRSEWRDDVQRSFASAFTTFLCSLWKCIFKHNRSRYSWDWQSETSRENIVFVRAGLVPTSGRPSRKYWKVLVGVRTGWAENGARQRLARGV